jgi:hypothetical protein
LTLTYLQVISKLALGITNAGLGSMEDAFLCIVPPLSLNQKLPVDAAVNHILRGLEDDERVRNWEKCTQVYRELLDFVGRFPSTSSSFFIIRAAVATIEYLWRMTETCRLYRLYHDDDQEARMLEDHGSELGQAFSRLLSTNPDIKVHLRAIYKLQKRWNDYQTFLDSAEPEKTPKSEGPGDLCRPLKDTGYFSRLHEDICCNSTLSLTQGDPENNDCDCLGWTPLHYAVLTRNKENVE